MMTKYQSVSKHFARLKSWANSYAPDVTFRAPVSPTAIVNFSEKSGRAFPEELRQLLLEADGETRKSAGMIGNWRLMPLTEIQAAWGLLKNLSEKGAFADSVPKPSPYVQQVWWHQGWIPFVSSDTGNYFCIDTAPPEPQHNGQVLLFLQDNPQRFLVAGSLCCWMEQIVEDLETGLYHYDSINGFNGEAFMWSALEGKHIFDPFEGKLVV